MREEDPHSIVRATARHDAATRRGAAGRVLVLLDVLCVPVRLRRLCRRLPRRLGLRVAAELLRRRRLRGQRRGLPASQRGENGLALLYQLNQEETNRRRRPHLALLY